MEEILKLEDLMVNDIVLAEAILEDEYGDEAIELHPFRITDISPSGEVYNDNGDNCKFIGNWMDDCEAEILGDLEPMPLTPEILEANGFNQEKDGAYTYYDDVHNPDKEYIAVLLHQDLSVRHVEIRRPRCSFDSDTIRNVHELQHSLRDCGYKDIANNFKIKQYESN